MIAIGPLTNLALAYSLDPKIATGKFNCVGIMGGTDSGVGIREFFSAEFNLFLDPEAAKIVVKVLLLDNLVFR
jgi:inosine-uridine nucleoside N-ribohydrolase